MSIKRGFADPYVVWLRSGQVDCTQATIDLDKQASGMYILD